MQKAPPDPDRESAGEHWFCGRDRTTYAAFLEKKGIAAPSQDLPETQHETELKMACIAAVEPAWDEHEGLRALEAGFKMMNPDLYDALVIAPSMMAEVLAASEAQGVYDYDAALSQKRAKKRVHGSDARGDCEQVFKKPAAGKWAATDKRYLVGSHPGRS